MRSINKSRGRKISLYSERIRTLIAPWAQREGIMPQFREQEVVTFLGDKWFIEDITDKVIVIAALYPDGRYKSGHNVCCEVTAEDLADLILLSEG